MCHECGGAYLNLAAHVAMSHRMTAAEYREVYENPRTTQLVAASVRERTSRRALRPQNLSQLAAARDPQAAAAARGPDVFAAMSRTRRARARRA